MPAPPPLPCLRFGVFELDAGASTLRRSGHVVPLRPQALRLLALLAERRGELVTREDARAAIWGPEAAVDVEQGLNDCIKEIRAALRDSARTPVYVETLPRRGYRFVAPIELLVATSPAAATLRPPAAPRRAAGCLTLAGLFAAALVIWLLLSAWDPGGSGRFGGRSSMAPDPDPTLVY
jgi:DNA-binding winged helix-turn-helix (wHTH) protein